MSNVCKKTLVVGASGFIGSHLVERLLANGIEVRAGTRRGTGLITKESLSDERIEVVHLDLTNQELTNRACQNIHTVYHLASSCLPHSSNQDPLSDVSQNLIGILNLLNACIKSGVQQVVTISSGGTVYGYARETPIKEDHPTEPICSYGITKLAIEKYIGLYRHLHGLKGVVLRVANPYGERQRMNKAQGVVPAFLKKALNDEILEIWGDGTAVRDFLYVGDVIDALLAAQSYSGNEWIFNIGSGSGLSINNLINHIEAELGRKVQTAYKPSRNFDVPTNVLCTAKARTHLGWKPVVGVAEGLHRFRMSLLND